MPGFCFQADENVECDMAQTKDNLDVVPVRTEPTDWWYAEDPVVVTNKRDAAIGAALPEARSERSYGSALPKEETRNPKGHKGRKINETGRNYLQGGGGDVIAALNKLNTTVLA